MQSDKFPLKYGSGGKNVKQLQQALLKLYGPSILPRYKDDGDYGNETAAAVGAKYGTEIVSKELFNEILSKAYPGEALSEVDIVVSYTEALRDDVESWFMTDGKLMSEVFKLDDKTFKQVVDDYNAAYGDLAADLSDYNIIPPVLGNVISRIENL